MKKTLLAALLFCTTALTAAAQGIIVHETNSNKTVYNSKDVKEIEFTGDEVETTTSTYATKKELNELKTVVENKANASALDAKADKSELDSKADKSEISNLATKAELDAKADASALNSKADKSELDNKLDKSEISNFATKSELDVKADVTALEGKADKSELTNLATKSALEGKADKSDLKAVLDQIQSLQKLVESLQKQLSNGYCDCTKPQGEAVDLGLSVKWASCNIGASKPEDYGYYFAWGETKPKSNYSWSTYFDSVDGNGSNFTKYPTDKKTVLDAEDDAAHVNWGGSWRMPTMAEQDELRTKCTWTWTTQNGVNGYKVTGTNGNSIFLPAAGCRNGSDLVSAGSHGNYWSSSLTSGYSIFAYSLSFYSSNVDWYDSARYCGRSVRAVCP